MNNSNRSPLIPSSFFKGGMKSFLFLVLFSFMLTYGFSSIVYFTNLIIVDGTSNKYEFGVVIQNLIFSFVSVAMVWFFIRNLDHKINNTFLKYLCIFILIEIVIVMASWYMYEFVWKDLAPYQRNGGPVLNIGFQAALIPGFVGIIYFYFWKNSQKINQKIDEQEVMLLQLEQNKTKAELTALEARINPHFLYNALNSIASLVHEKPDTAEEMTMKLSALFRKTTSRDNSTFYSLEEEIDIVKTYLEIEQIRFGERLQFSTELDENSKKAKVPKFIIQPLVENAIKHGVSKITGKGIIKVNAYTDGKLLTIKVHDNGPQFKLGEHVGYGLTSIQEKLKLLFGEKAHFNINSNPIKEISIEIPYEKA
ncbi:Histidine kinase [Spirosomataceae bacterium TFI 002]|nr:Histidine kinase [Spirosomataceae bacterium TFI 002]